MEEIARPYRICLIGSESTGKTDLAEELARHFSAPSVGEFARDYALRVNRDLSYVDVAPIARGQIALEDRLAAADGNLLILDTDLISTVVYSRYYYGGCPEWIEQAARDRRADLYLFLDVDVPWIADPVRDSAERREALHDHFRRALGEFGAEFVVISGPWEERWKRAVEAITAKLCS
jgi:HTH-type transcriptional repressor of NAD biosynthesis genes